MVHSNYEIGFKYVKENVPEREFQESHENFSATFKRKIAGIKSWRSKNQNIATVWNREVL